jgi:hypothetical protein
MAEQSEMAKMVATATPWMAVLYEIGHLLLWMNEMYQDIRSVPDQLKEIFQYYTELTACLDTLKRVCLPEGTETLHPDDIKSIIPISERSTKTMKMAMQMINSCIDSCPAEPSRWDSFCEIFSPPEWMKRGPQFSTFFRMSNKVWGPYQPSPQQIHMTRFATCNNRSRR